MGFKVLDRLFFKGFIGPCILAFFIVEFVLMMQKLWKEIDKILGKGYGPLDFAELMYYFSLAIIPLALPLTILLSSVMVYGDMAEKYELSSAKSAGISFFRLLKPGLVVAIGVFFFSILASNVLKPNANRGFEKKMRDMKTNSLTFAFDEKIFNREFKDFSIRVGKKYDDGKTIDDIMIYDHTDPDNSVYHLTRAKHGEMYTSVDRKYLIMDLKDGYQVKEVRGQSPIRTRKGHNSYGRPMTRIKFATLRKVFDLSEMLDNSVVNISYKEYDMMNTSELLTVIDSMGLDAEKIRSKNHHNFNSLKDPNSDSTTIKLEMLEMSKKESYNITKSVNLATKDRAPKKVLSNKLLIKKDNFTTPDSVISIMTEWDEKEVTSLIDIVKVKKRKKMLDMTKKNALAISNYNGNNKNEVTIIERTRARYVFSLHQIYSRAMVCIIFLFIGAPAGAIVKKGGFGYPLLIAIGFYITFVMSDIIGKKLMGSGALSPVAGAWIPCLILIPFAVYLSWRALNDSKPIIIPFLKQLFKGGLRKVVRTGS